MADNLNIPQVASNQNQKEVTINDATAKLSGAVTDSVSLDLSGGNVAVSNLQFQSNLKFETTGNTGSQSLTFPAIQRELFIVKNSGSSTLPVKCGSTTLSLGAGSTAIYATDGTTNGITKIISAGEQDYVASFGGKPPANLTILMPLNQSIKLLSGLPGSNFAIDVNPSDGAMDFTIYKNASGIGTISFATDGTPTVTFSSDVTFSVGDKLKVVAPGSPDSTGSGAGLNFKAQVL